MVDLSEVCRDAVDLLRPLWRKRSRPGRGPINVQLRTEPDLTVRGDPTELREVVTNVLKNAIDSIASGGRVTVSARRQRGQIHLRIRDNGSGIPSEILTKVFDPFYTTKGERGTGLGLSLSQQIVDQHGGSIKIDSKEGSGTTVSVMLPAAESGTERARGRTEAMRPAHAALRVVVVDDDSDVLKSLCTYLERSGYDVIPAVDGADGLKKTIEHKPDVVLTDVSMPGMDGIELCRRLHAVQPKLPIVLMSGWASDLNHASAREAGARDVLSKPFEMPEVTRLLAEVAEST
jgi:CheY-like chemotaxis protein